MATGHFYLNHNSPGAPTYHAGAGKLIELLDWALDIGTATYWEKVYSGTNKAVYRSKTGLRPYLRVDDSLNEKAWIRMYETMSDVDTGTGAAPDGISQTTDYGFPKADANDGTNAHDFYIVGDSEFFTLAVNHDNAYTLDGQQVRFCPMAFGEVASLLAVDNYPALLMGVSRYTVNGADYYEVDYHCWDNRMGYRTGSVVDNTNCGDPGISPQMLWLRNASGTVNSSGGYAWSPIGYNDACYRADQEGPIEIAPFYVQCSNGSTSGSSTAYWQSGNGGARTRGKIPYMYKGNWRAGSSYGGPVTGDIVTIGSSQFVVMVAWGESTSDSWDKAVKLFRITDDEPDRP